MKKITFELEVYTYQIDYANHVSNIVYIQWMEIGRLKLLDAVGLSVHKIAGQGLLPVLVNTSIFYKRPLYLGDTVYVELWLSDLKKISAQIEFCFYNCERTLVATGLQQGLFVDQKTRLPRRLRPEERSLFEPYLHITSDDTILVNN